MAEIERILATIRAVESTGDYTRRSDSSSASGAYQFIDSTWRAEGGGLYAPRAYLATPAQQDTIARAYVQEIIAAHPGTAPTVVVPRVWYVGDATKPNSYRPPGNPLTVGEYAMKWLVAYAKAGGGGGVDATRDFIKGVATDPTDAAKAIVDGGTSYIGEQVQRAIGAMAEPFLKGLGRIAIIGISVTGGIALVVLGAWRGVKAGG